MNQCRIIRKFLKVRSWRVNCDQTHLLERSHPSCSGPKVTARNYSVDLFRSVPRQTSSISNNFVSSCCIQRMPRNSLCISTPDHTDIKVRLYSQAPYDPEKDAYIQGILKEFGRDFSHESHSEEKFSDLDSGYESDAETNVEKSDTSSSDSSSDLSSSESDSDVEKQNILRDSTSDAVSGDAEAKLLEEFEDADAYSEEEFEEIYERVHVVPLKRGKTGVFDLEELVAVLRNENAVDLCVIQVPPQFNFVDYMVIVSGRSVRHLVAMAEYVKWLHKRKKGKKDSFLKIEGLDSKDWIAMDLGNIVLHFFMPETREQYDLETLWAVGNEYDSKSNQQEDAYGFLFDQQRPDFNAENRTADLIVDHQGAVDDPDSYEMHSDSWHQVGQVDFEKEQDGKS